MSVLNDHPLKSSTAASPFRLELEFRIQGVDSMRNSSGVRNVVIAGLLLSAGCGGDDSGVLKVSGGGPDGAAQIAEQNRKAKADPKDPSFEKMAGPDKRNTARDPGVSSGGGTSSAILD